jgi:hypothetical protein
MAQDEFEVVSEPAMSWVRAAREGISWLWEGQERDTEEKAEKGEEKREGWRGRKRTFSSQLRNTHRVSLRVLTVLKVGENVLAVSRSLLKTSVNPRPRNACKVVDRRKTAREPRVDVLHVRADPGREAAESSGVLAAFVEDLDGGEVDDGTVFLSDGDNVGTVTLEHVEGSTKGEVADDVESESVEPEGKRRG